jgi:hypothetical protein
MTKQDTLFIVLLSLSLALMAAVVVQNLRGEKAATPAEIRTTPAGSYDPAQTDSVRKKLTDLGLRPHEGRYWK